jgi:hypothetical protein
MTRLRRLGSMAIGVQRIVHDHPVPPASVVSPPASGPALSALTLSANAVAEGASPGTLIGALLGATSGSALTLADDAGGRFTLSGANVVAGLVATDYETATSHQITVRETLAGATNSPRDTALTVNVLSSGNVAARGHISTEAQTFAASIEAAFAANTWAGTDGVTVWDTDQVATSAQDFNNKAAALVTGAGQKHRLRLASSGDWTTTTLNAMSVRGKDFLTGNGCLRVEPETGEGPLITIIVRCEGARGVHFHNITCGQGIQIDRTSGRPLWSVVRVSGCRIGHYYRGLSVLANYTFGISASHVEDVAFVGNSIRGVSTAMRSLGVRWCRVFGNDIQDRSNDCFSRNSATSLIASSSLTTQWPGSPVYSWYRLNTDRNTADDPALVAVHFDTNQTGNATDAADYHYLDEFNVSYSELVNTGLNTAQGHYQDDTPRRITGVTHSNLIGMGAYHAILAFGGSSGASEHWLEHNTCYRVAGLPFNAESVPDNEPRIQTESFAPGTVLTHARNNIAAAFSVGPGGGKVAGTFDLSGNVIASPQIGKAAPERYEDVFVGSFTTDPQGRTTYAFTDDGAGSQAAFRAVIHAIFAPKGAALGKGAPDPALWPAT